MKNTTTLLLFFLFCLQTFAQVDSKPSSKPKTNDGDDLFGISGVFRLYPIFTIQLGDNVFSKAHETKTGIGGHLCFLKYGDLRAGFIYELNYYSVSDVSKVGNFATSNSQNTTWSISYDFKVNKKMILVPTIGYGSSFVNQETNSKKFGKYSGDSFRLGLYTDYELGKSVGAFLGVHYINTQYSIKTNAEFEDYFQKIPQIQCTLGLKIF